MMEGEETMSCLPLMSSFLMEELRTTKGVVAETSGSFDDEGEEGAKFCRSRNGKKVCPRVFPKKSFSLSS
jgi:hypothetical protein